MSINVRGATGKPANATTNKTKAATGGNAAKGVSSSASNTENDSVELTEEASRIQKIENSLASIPVVDPGRVKAIGDALEDGSYRVDAEKVADKIIEIEQQIDKD